MKEDESCFTCATAGELPVDTPPAFAEFTQVFVNTLRRTDPILLPVPRLRDVFVMIIKGGQSLGNTQRGLHILLYSGQRKLDAAHEDFHKFLRDNMFDVSLFIMPLRQQQQGQVKCEFTLVDHRIPNESPMDDYVDWDDEITQWKTREGGLPYLSQLLVTQMAYVYQYATWPERPYVFDLPTQATH